MLSKGKWVLVKRSIKRIGGSNFYFDSKGVRVKKAGVYKTANGYLAYVNRKGVVYKREYNWRSRDITRSILEMEDQQRFMDIMILARLKD